MLFRSKAAREVALALFLSLGSAETALSSRILSALPAAYGRHAAEALRIYGTDARINGLVYPLHDEKLAVSTFVRAIREAVGKFAAAPDEDPCAPPWAHIEAEQPGFFPELCAAIAADNGAQVRPRRNHHSGKSDRQG